MEMSDIDTSAAVIAEHGDELTGDASAGLLLSDAPRVEVTTTLTETKNDRDQNVQRQDQDLKKLFL